MMHGWTLVIAQVFRLDIPVNGKELNPLCGVAATSAKPSRVIK
ncbi:MAG TPA: hypothetical protein VGD78_11330 [Chthoniobacterales bacterium]